MAGFWDFLKRGSVSNAVFEPKITYIGGPGMDDVAALYGLDPSKLTAAQMWRTQPHLRTVVAFLARNIAQLGLQSFERVSETDRKRDRSSLVARVLRNPGGDMTAYDLVFALVGDMALYDTAYWWIHTSSDTPTGIAITRLPVTWVNPIRGTFKTEKYMVSMGTEVLEIPAAQILAFNGYSPTDPGKGSPTVEALKETLQEQVEAARYRGQVWKRGGRVSAVIERPETASDWSPEARETFREDWYAKYTGNGPHAGGTPILEDGMKLNRVDFTATEQQFVEAAKLSFATVASAFHVNPTMVGILDNANYSNVREFRKMLYGDTLGPLIAQIEDRLNTFFLSMMKLDNERFYLEFNIAEKLQGDFGEQTAAFQAAVGRPWMKVDEARARLNMQALGGNADDLVTPLNVLIGHQASVTDTGTQNEKPKARQVKARAPQPYEAKHAEVLAAFFKRQAAVVKTALGVKADGEFWDGERWDAELAEDLFKLSLQVTQQVAATTLDGIGFSPDEYDVDRTKAWLLEVAKRSAGSINEATKVAVDAALLDEDDPSDAVTNVFDVAQDSRSTEIATTAVTLLSGFASTEAAKQATGDKATKTWLVTSGNPRPSHSAVNGETVKLSETFSNSLMWPGDSAGGADEVANCSCELVINA